MSTEVGLYLSGSIKKGRNEADKQCWDDIDIEQIRYSFAPTQVVLMNPASRSDDVADFLSVFGRDVLQVYCCDYLLVDARAKRGIGVGSEMTIARWFGIPVVTIAPTHSHYRRDNFELQGRVLRSWTHPFVYGLSDSIVPTVQEGVVWIRKQMALVRGEGQQKTGIEQRLYDAMLHYVYHQLFADIEMRELILAHSFLRSRLNNLLGPHPVPEFLNT